MDLKNLKYEIQKNKLKYSMRAAFVLLIISVILVFKVFGVKLDYFVKYEDNKSLKSVLAEAVISGNIDGEIKAYNIDDGKVLDSKKLEGVYLYSKSDNMEFMNAYNMDSSKLYNISVKNKKINVSKTISIDVSKQNLLSFKFKDSHFVGLIDGGKQLIYKNIKTGEESIIDLKLSKSVSSYDILGNNLVLTSGDFIYSVNLKTLKSQSIDIGESSLSMHILGGKLFIHNGFGSNRNKSILLDVNPNTLVINNVIDFKDSGVSLLETGSKSKSLYYAERFITQSNENVTQVFKMIGKDLKGSTNLIKHTSKTILSSENSYGYLGYIYSREGDKLRIFNLKSLDLERTITIKDDYYMPVY